MTSRTSAPKAYSAEISHPGGKFLTGGHILSGDRVGAAHRYGKGYFCQVGLRRADLRHRPAPQPPVMEARDVPADYDHRQGREPGRGDETRQRG